MNIVLLSWYESLKVWDVDWRLCSSYLWHGSICYCCSAAIFVSLLFDFRLFDLLLALVYCCSCSLIACLLLLLFLLLLFYCQHDWKTIFSSVDQYSIRRKKLNVLELWYEKFPSWENMWGYVFGVKTKPSVPQAENFDLLVDTWETDNSKVITWINKFVT